jgi:hypothetical protein
VSLGHANLSLDIGPDSVRVIPIVHAPTRLHTKHSLSNFNLHLEWVNCVLLMDSLPDRSVVEISSLQPFVYIFGVHQTKLEFSGTVPCVHLTAYHVVHVPLHLIHTMVILHLGTSCPCHHVGSFLRRHVKVPCTLGGTAHHYARTFSLSAAHGKREHTIRCLPSCSANLRYNCYLGNAGGTWTVLLLQIRVAVQNSQQSYRPFPYVSLGHEAEPALHLRLCPRLHLTSP